jgi:hypothetical protein
MMMGGECYSPATKDASGNGYGSWLPSIGQNPVLSPQHQDVQIHRNHTLNPSIVITKLGVDGGRSPLVKTSLLVREMGCYKSLISLLPRPK